MTVVLLVVVISIMIANSRPPQSRNDPFIVYEKNITISLENARTQLGEQSWEMAIDYYRDVLDQDPINEYH